MSPELLLALGVAAVLLGGILVSGAAYAGWAARGRIADADTKVWERERLELEARVAQLRDGVQRALAVQGREAENLRRRASALAEPDLLRSLELLYPDPAPGDHGAGAGADSAPQA